MRLADFAGEWRVERTIEDRRAGRRGGFAGVAWFRPDPEGLAYLEEGSLCFPGTAPVTATRRYLWREDAGGIEVVFPDGRLFHRLAQDATEPRADHDCPPDRYSGRYFFGSWPIWRAEWQVRGPRKDYGLVTVYRPAGQAGGIPA